MGCDATVTFYLHSWLLSIGQHCRGFLATDNTQDFSLGCYGETWFNNSLVWNKIVLRTQGGLNAPLTDGFMSLLQPNLSFTPCLFYTRLQQLLKLNNLWGFEGEITLWRSQAKQIENHCVHTESYSESGFNTKSHCLPATLLPPPTFHPLSSLKFSFPLPLLTPLMQSPPAGDPAEQVRLQLVGGRRQAGGSNVPSQQRGSIPVQLQQSKVIVVGLVIVVLVKVDPLDSRH